MQGLFVVLYSRLEALSSISCWRESSLGGSLLPANRAECPGEEEPQQVTWQDHPPDRLAQTGLDRAISQSPLGCLLGRLSAPRGYRGNSIAPVKTPELGQDEEPWYSSVGAMSSNTLESDTQQPETDRLRRAEPGGHRLDRLDSCCPL